MYYKAKIAISAARNKVGKPPLLFQAFNRYHGDNQVIARVVNIDMAADEQGVLTHIGAHFSTTLPRLLTWTEAETYARKIDQLNVGADHLDVKTDVNWRRMYQLKQSKLLYMAADGTVSNGKDENTIPCHNCGVILPLEFLQVDHHMPQAGADDLHLLKTLRALGLTTSLATGAKGTAFAAGTLLTTLTIAPKARDRSYNHLYTPTPAAKWTTNEKGDALLSLLAYVGAMADVARMCKNSLLNLVPLCPECNRVKWNWIKPTV